MNSERPRPAKTTAIVLLVLAGLMFAGLGCTGIKQSEMDAKNREIKTLNEQLAEASRNEAFLVNSIKAQSIEIEKRGENIRELRIEMRKLLVKMIGLPEADMPYVDEYFTKMLDLTKGSELKPNPGQTIEDISFALRVSPDNSPISPTAIFKSGDRRIYACFKNQGVLEGLAKVITRWMNKTTNEVIGLDTKALNPGVSDNFIWREKKDGWPAGEYLVELFSTDILTRIAQGAFMVLPEHKKEKPKEDTPDKSREPDSPK
ncbi:MAG: hypothetical protein HZA49_00160 [Planctomycetes bacterium]|nr:hypothetical protein [Planctomycetota bacterium]